MKRWEVGITGIARYEECHIVEAETQEEAERMALAVANLEVDDLEDAEVEYCVARKPRVVQKDGK